MSRRRSASKQTTSSRPSSIRAFVANGSPGPVNGTFMISTPRNSPLIARPSTVTETSIGFACLSFFSRRARPLRKLSAPLGFSRFDADLRNSANNPTPNPSRNREVPHGALTDAMSKGCVWSIFQVSTSSCGVPAIPSERAILLAVPSGNSATGSERSRSLVTTSVMVPSPPAMTRSSVLFSRASSTSSPLTDI